MAENEFPRIIGKEGQVIIGKDGKTVKGQKAAVEQLGRDMEAGRVHLKGKAGGDLTVKTGR